jgi:hypothetical protein
MTNQMAVIRRVAVALVLAVLILIGIVLVTSSDTVTQRSSCPRGQKLITYHDDSVSGHAGDFTLCVPEGTV